MIKADEMFEELGYEKIVELKEPDDYDNGVIELILYRTISKSSNYDESYLTIEELQAINEKVKELGWNES